METIGSLTILKRIVVESLEAFPDDAHIRVLNFFVARNIGEASQTILKGAWSRALLTHDAFGKGRRNNLDADIFFNDFIAELSKHFADGDGFQKLAETLRFTNTELQSINITDTLDEHQEQKIETLIQAVDSARSYMTDYVDKLYAAPDHFFTLTEQQAEHCLDAMIQYQEVMRKMKVVWKKADLKGGFLRPVAKKVLFEHSYRLGKLVQGLDDVVDPPLFCSTVQVIGLEVPHDSSSAIRYCWNTFGFLHDIIHTKHFNPFPKPIAATRMEETYNTIFCYEVPTAKFLFNLIGSELGRLLRKYPTLPLIWSVQLSLAVQALARTEGRLVQPPTLRDVLVRDDGLLLIGGLCFMESGENAGNRNAEVFTPLVYDILSSSLCLSRTEHVILPNVMNFASAGSIFQQHKGKGKGVRMSDGEGEEENKRRAHSDRKFVISTGSTLSLKISCGKVADSIIFSRDKAYITDDEGVESRTRDLDHYYSILIVVTDWTPTPSANRSTSGVIKPPKVSCKIVKEQENASALLEIETQHPGELLVECSTLIPDKVSLTTAERRLGGIIVSAIEMPAAESVEVQELVGFIEERHVWKKDTAIFQSYLFSQARDFLFDTDKTNDLLLQCSISWRNVKKGMGVDKSHEES